MKVHWRSVSDVLWWVVIFCFGYRFGQPTGAPIPLWLWLVFLTATVLRLIIDNGMRLDNSKPDATQDTERL